MNLACICKTLGELYGSLGCAARGLLDRTAELHVDPRCPLHGSSAEAKAQREAWRESVEERLA